MTVREQIISTMLTALRDCVECLRRLPDGDGAFRVSCLTQAQNAIAVATKAIPTPSRTLYVLKIDSYDGEQTLRHQSIESWTPEPGDSTLFAVVAIDEHGAQIVDDGYRSIEEAKAAWPEAIEPKP